MKLAILMLLAVTGFSAAAHEEGFGILKGEKLSLYYSEHAFAGQVNERLVYATPLESEHGVNLTVRTNNKEFRTTFRKGNPEMFAATLATQTKDGKALETSFVVTSINAKTALIEGKLDADAFTVKVSSDKIEGNHFIDPLFEVTVGERNYSFRLENGEACIMCATKISFVVLTVLRSSGAI